LFTTHTPVEAGFDRFAPELMDQYFTKYAESELRIEFDELMALGRRDPLDRSEPFNMAYLALRGSGAANGVSQLHGEVSRRIFQVLFPRWPEREVPVSHVTNGVHVPTWESPDANKLWAGVCGDERWMGAIECVEADFRKLTDAQLWQLRTSATKALIEYTRTRLARQRGTQGASEEEIAEA